MPVNPPHAPGRWTVHAACAGRDPELWFAPNAAPEAKAICGGCPVRAECLTASMTGASHGIWGGLDEDERRALRRGVRPARTALKKPQQGTPRPKPKRPMVHGTKSGYDLHRDLNEPACAACLEAKAEYSRQYRAARKARAA